METSMDENDIYTVIGILAAILGCEIFQTLMMMFAN